jgi:hypothetical protein
LLLTCQVLFSIYSTGLGGSDVVVLFWLMIIIVMSFITIELIEGISSSFSDSTVDEEWIAPLAMMSFVLICVAYMALN